MQEQTKTITQLEEAPAGPGVFNESDDAEGRGGLVRVTSGFNTPYLPVGGMTVAQIRRRFSDILGIGPGNLAFVDGQEVGDETVVRTGQALMFGQPSGEKGRVTAPSRRAA